MFEFLLLLIALGVVIAWIALRGDESDTNARSAGPKKMGDAAKAPSRADREQDRIDAYAESFRTQNARTETPEEIWDALAVQPVPCKALLQLRYRDSKGDETERKVGVKQTDLFSHHGYFFGYCHRRRENRTFRSDRVMHAKDLDTGLDVPKVHELLEARYRLSPGHALDELWSTHKKAMRVLLWVGRSDGGLSAAERVIVRQAARALTNDPRISNHGIDQVLREIETPPSQGTFENIAREVAKDATAEQRAILLAASEDIVASQPTVVVREQAAIFYVRKHFGP